MSDEKRKTASSHGGRSTLVQSVDRAVTVLEVLARRGEVGVTEIAHELGVHKSTAFRLALVLEQRGLVEQTADRGKYRLAYGIVRLAGAASAQLDVTRESGDVCRRLAEEFGEGINVAVLDSGEAINVSQVRGLNAISAYNWVGQRTPLHATSSGKVLLAFEEAEAVEELLSHGLERFTEHTVCDVVRIREELGQVREQGWGSTMEEYEVGLNAVACPIEDGTGSVIASLSISGPSYRLSPDAFEQVARSVGAEAVAVSKRLERRARAS